MITRRPRKLTAKQRAVRGAAFIAATEALLVRLGATEDLTREWCVPTHGENGRPYQIETIYGTLRVIPYDNWIACRFEDPAKMGEQLYPAPNPFSGKWNFHLDGNVERLPYFEHCLTATLIPTLPEGKS